jgi:vacuolar-type H+-ATPase subunit I/STV1
MLVIIGAIDFFEGLIAVIRGSYYQYTPQGIVVFSTKEWGWIHIIVGILLILIGLALAAKSGWARWAAVVVVVVNLLGQLGWLGSSTNPLWSLTVVTLQIIVLYALTVRWSEVAAY